MALYDRVLLTGMDRIEFLFSSQKQFEVWGRGVVVVSRLPRFSSIGCPSEWKITFPQCLAIQAGESKFNGENRPARQVN